MPCATNWDKKEEKAEKTLSMINEAGNKKEAKGGISRKIPLMLRPQRLQQGKKCDLRDPF